MQEQLWPTRHLGKLEMLVLVSSQVVYAYCQLDFVVQALIERQEKLSQLSDKTEAMRASADEFAQRAREIRRHYEDRSKKWWNVFL